jgi:hypothetical protein
MDRGVVYMMVPFETRIVCHAYLLDYMYENTGS